jgi:single stranded DNA-binding protein
MIINNIIVSGRLGADAETRDANGKLVTNFRMAVYQGKDKPSSWLKVTAWERTAEFCQGITKGCEVIVEGSLSTSEYTTKDGATKTSVEIRANRVHQLAKMEHKASEDVDF